MARAGSNTRYTEIADRDFQRAKVTVARAADPGQTPVTKDSGGKAVPRDDHEAIAHIWRFLDGKNTDFP